ncbi:MAG TPA: phage protease [Methylococcus sp.]|nr:phage protease [Methylococcus sp.]
MIASRRDIAALSIALDPGNLGTVQLFPAGRFSARDGRPATSSGIDEWILDDDAAASLLAAARERKTPYVIDYEHQSLNALENGQPAPAAGWFSRLEWRPGQGLFAVDVQWTERARAYIQSGEYKYLSPVFTFDRKTGRITDLHMAALTNVPALDGMLPVAASSSFPVMEKPMHPSLKKLLEIDSDSPSDQEIEAACERLATKISGYETEVAALKEKTQAATDPTKYVPIEALKELQQEFGKLRMQHESREREALIEANRAKLPTPTLIDWAKSQPIEALKAYLESAPAIAALTGAQTGGKGHAGGDGLSDEDLAVCRMLGLKTEELKKVKGVS